MTDERARVGEGDERKSLRLRETTRARESCERESESVGASCETTVNWARLRGPAGADTSDTSWCGALRSALRVKRKRRKHLDRLTRRQHLPLVVVVIAHCGTRNSHHTLARVGQAAGSPRLTPNDSSEPKQSSQSAGGAGRSVGRAGSRDVMF